jgi:type IX secretion system PorP/SprF family membrane protein
MKTINKISLGLLAVLAGLSAGAQQDPMYTHYMFNTLMVNPAYAGSRNALTITGLYRSQWVDFKGAPTIQSITAHSPLKNDHYALGLSVMNDKIGVTNKTSVFANFAYRMDLTKKSKLALGISGGVNIFQANLRSLQLDQEGDPTFQANINNRVTPNFGFGAYYSRERFYAGVSIPNLIRNNFENTGSALKGSEQRHYFFIAGGLLHLSENLDFKPTTFIKLLPAAPVQADLTASFIVLKKLSLGAMYRTGDAFGALIGFNITSQLYLGYSYDWSYGLSSARYNRGSHEIAVRYDVPVYGKKQVHTPRYF